MWAADLVGPLPMLRHVGLLADRPLGFVLRNALRPDNYR